MDHLKNILGKKFHQTGLAKQVETALIIEEFNKLLTEVFGPDIVKRVKPIFIKDKNLLIACLSSVVAQEITFKKAELIKKINSLFHQEALKDIKFRF